MDIEQKRIKIRNVIEEANSQFLTISFIKKDMSLRSMNIQPAAAKNHLVSEYKSESTRQAVETRKANNPNLINVWDVQKSEMRSINMDTVYEIKSDGVIYHFSDMDKEVDLINQAQTAKKIA